jgi:hypothetical protein
MLSSPHLSRERKPHNKSKKTVLAILSYSDEELEEYHNDLRERCVEVSGLNPTLCLETRMGDGKFSVKQKKICFGYQLGAWSKFGREKLANVPPSKRRDDLTISHLCGSSNSRCIRRRHLVLEPKWVNDERTHCHFCIRNMKAQSATDEDFNISMAHFLSSGACQHDPHCGSDDPKGACDL